MRLLEVSDHRGGGGDPLPAGEGLPEARRVAPHLLRDGHVRARCGGHERLPRTHSFVNSEV